MNIDTDLQYAFTRSIANNMFKNYDGVLNLLETTGKKDASGNIIYGDIGTFLAAEQCPWFNRATSYGVLANTARTLRDKAEQQPCGNS
jgi:hypothetical protein